MSKSQAAWWEKKGSRQYPGLCDSLEKARYLIVWTVSTEFSTGYQAVNRTAQANTSTTGNQNGTFNTYGGLAAWGNYSGNSTSSSTTTITMKETVPVTVTTDHCYVYVLRSVGNNVWEDNRAAARALAGRKETRSQSAQRAFWVGSVFTLDFIGRSKRLMNPSGV